MVTKRISVKLSEVCTKVTDGTHDSPKLQTSGVPFIKAKHVSSGSVDFQNCDYITYEDHLKVISRSNPEFGDTLFVNIGASLGDSAFIPDIGEFSIKNVALFKPDHTQIFPKYLFYVVRSFEFQESIKNKKSGSAQPFVGLDTLRNHELKIFPELPIQRRIAGILSAYDDMIEVNTRRIKALEEMARRTYEDWIVHCGEVPKANLTEIAELTMGQSPKSEFYNEDGEGMPFHQGVTNFGTLYPKHKLFSTAGNREAEEGDILFSVRAPVGRINIAPSKMILGRGLAAIRSNNEAQAFLLSALKHEFSEEDKIGNGAIFKAVTKSDMQNIELPNPPDDELQKVEGIFNSYWEQIGNLVKQNTNLRAQRDLLLPRLVSGEIDVSDAEQTLEAAE